jgi:hypothetical protein
MNAFPMVARHRIISPFLDRDEGKITAARAAGIQTGADGASLEAGGRVGRRSRAPGQSATVTGPDNALAGPMSDRAEMGGRD